MKKHALIILITLTCALACLFFPTLKMVDVNAASIQNVSGNSIPLTGLDGYNPPHFFLDDNQKSTLVNAQTKSVKEKYYAITASGKGTSSGWAEFQPTSDMQPFIEKGLLYATASSNITTGNDTTVTLTISSGESMQTVSSTGGNTQTPNLKIDNYYNNIRFAFEATSPNNKNNFVMHTPTINLYTIINSVTLDNESQKVSPGQMVKINAYNDVTAISGVSGNFLAISKINHAIKFNFVSGGEYVQVIGGNLSILNTAPDGATIKFNVYSNKDSYSQTKIYSSNYVTLTVDRRNVNVKVLTDFASPAKIVGEGSYAVGRSITLTVTPNKDFEFLGWYVDGEFKTKNKRTIITATFGQEIFAKFIKSISIEAINVKPRTYDGSAVIDQNSVSVKFAGLEAGHELMLAGVKYSYLDANASSSKLINAQFTALSLEGQDAELYKLKTQTLPTSFGEITKRDALIYPQSAQKEYGYDDTDSPINYDVENLVEGENLKGRLSRNGGEEVGKYTINKGDLEQNTNYNILIQNTGAYFEIVPRILSLENVSVSQKIYDGTAKADVSAKLKPIFNNEDVNVKIEAEYASVGAQQSDIEVKITDMQLYGADKDNYVVAQYSQTIYGTILPKPIVVKAQNCTCIYGDAINLTYKADLVNDDILFGSLIINNKLVGEHEIKIGTLNNSNYEIVGYEPATCTILARDAYVVAEAKTKFYGDADPDLTYSVTNMLMGDQLSGGLERAIGEDVGSYTINAGSLNNPNYNVVFSGNTLKIEKRKIVVMVEFLNKVYDGSTSVEFDVKYYNNIKNENFVTTMNANLISANSGKETIVVNNENVNGENINNYYFNFVYTNQEIEVEKRSVRVFVDVHTKVYGEQDPTFTFTASNMVPNELLNLTLCREKGEDVGFYEYILNESYEADNPNYDISLVESNFEIVPKQLKISVTNQFKRFGDADPEFKFDLLDELCFNDSVEDVVNGQILREPGESVGVYEYNLSKISTNPNYIFKNVGDSNFIITKRPVVVNCAESSKFYGEEDPVFQYHVTNDVEGERLNVEIVREYGENVGKYKLSCATNSDERYTIEFVEAMLTILPSEITIKADTKTKIYGEPDPAMSVSIISGFLKFNDRLNEIVSGNLLRKSGKDVGSYEITLGSLSLGENYKIKFEQGSFNIVERQIEVKAQNASKIYGEQETDLPYQILGEGLVNGDVIQGKLERQPGENVDVYQIDIGTLTAGSNYIINFVGAQFEILKRDLEIIPTTLYKQYGEADTELKYSIVGMLIGDDTLSGSLYRDEDSNEIENTGRYKIYSALENSNYNITLKEYYFTILPREIVIEAENHTIYYGEKDPELNYKIVSGTILPKDSITGNLTRLSGNSAGVYDIISTLTLGRNYNIQYIKGTLTILPKEITIKTVDYQKIYGQEDPAFNYEIVSGKLVNDDVLYGALTRERGEDVGTYAIIKSVYNANYNITLLPASLKIIKKDVYLISTIYNKIYDGTTKAMLKNPYVSGCEDELYLEYDKDNAANFKTAEIGKHIAVYVHDITLTGEKAHNYNLILPTNLYADITLQEIKNSQVCVTSSDPVLYDDYALNVVSEAITKANKIQNHNVVMKFNIWMEQEQEQVGATGAFKITINLPKKVYNKNNIYVYQKLADGNLIMLETEKGENGEIFIMASSLGEFYITTEDETWIDFATIVSAAILGTLCVLCVTINFIKRKKLKQNEN